MCHSPYISRYCSAFRLTLLKLSSVNDLHSREVSVKIVQNFNVLSFAAFHSVNWLRFVVVCVGWFFWFVYLGYLGGRGELGINRLAVLYFML